MTEYFITKDDLTISGPYAHKVLCRYKLKQDYDLVADMQLMAKYEKDPVNFNAFFKSKYNIENMYEKMMDYKKDIKFIYLPIAFSFDLNHFKIQNKNLIDKLEHKYKAKLSDTSLRFVYEVFNYCLPSKFSEEYKVTYEEFLFFCFYVGRIPCFNEDYVKFQEDIGNQSVDISLHNKLSENIRQYHLHMEEFWLDIHKAC